MNWKFSITYDRNRRADDGRSYTCKVERVAVDPYAFGARTRLREHTLMLSGVFEEPRQGGPEISKWLEFEHALILRYEKTSGKWSMSIREVGYVPRETAAKDEQVLSRRDADGVIRY